AKRVSCRALQHECAKAAAHHPAKQGELLDTRCSEHRDDERGADNRRDAKRGPCQSHEAWLSVSRSKLRAGKRRGSDITEAEEQVGRDKKRPAWRQKLRSVKTHRGRRWLFEACSGLRWIGGKSRGGKKEGDRQRQDRRRSKARAPAGRA